MLGKDALCRNRRRDLRRFLQCFCPELDKTRQKFFRQSLWAILLSGSLVVTRWLRWIPDRCRRPFSRLKRLLRQLASRDWDYLAVQRRYQQAWARHMDPDTPLIIDLSDLPRPRARRLKYLGLVRDGSQDGRLVSGYWCLEIYACWGKGRITPLLLHPYGMDDPTVRSENAQILRQVDRVMRATDGKGVLVMDIGADRDSLLIPWIDAHRRFVIRLRGDRRLLLDNGVQLPARHLAERLLQQAAAQGRRTAWTRVYLPERVGEPLYLVCRVLPGRDHPLMLLTSLTVENLEAANKTLWYYRRRWGCEESARFLKSRLGLERFALRTYEAFAPLLFLATVAMGLLTWLQMRFASLARWLARSRPGRRAVKFLYYRLLEWWESQILQALSNRIPP